MYPCPICQKQLSRRDNLARHIRLVQEKNSSRPIHLDGYIPKKPHSHSPYPSATYTEQSYQSSLAGPIRYSDYLGPDPAEDPPVQPYPRYHTEQQQPVIPPADRNFFIKDTEIPIAWIVPEGREDLYLPWAHPFTCVIAGPTGSGKTMFVRRFVKNIRDMMMPVPDRITWSYDVYQTIYGTITGVDFVQGLPDLDMLDPSERHLIIIDDQMDDVDQKVSDLFTKYSHHKNLSVILIVQNLFNKNKHHRTISLNTHYMILFKNPRDQSQMMSLAQQMYPHNMKRFIEAYEFGTSRPHGYLMIDMKQATPELLRLRSSIFPGEEIDMFVPK